MKKIKQLCFLVTCFLCSIVPSNAQSNVLSAGSDATSNKGSSAYSIGQSFYSLKTSGSATVTEGVQQVFEISVITGIEDNLLHDIDITLYPNPTTNFITLEVKDLKQEVLNYQIWDMAGNLLSSRAISSQMTMINLEFLPIAHYILSVRDQNNSFKSFIIIKTK